MNRIFWFYLSLFLLILLVGISSVGYFFPADVLNNIPSFSEDGWQRPKNALQADPVFQFEPWRDFAKSELLQGRIPLWNDLNGNGSPLLANSISAVFYPLNFLYYVFPSQIAINAISLLKLTLFFLFCYLYLRSLRISAAISLIGAAAASFSGYMILWLFWPQTNVYLFLPLILYITERLRQEKSYRYRWYALTAITYFLMILGNHPETLFHIALLHAGYIFFRFWKDYRTIIAIFCSIFAGFLLGAIQLLPLLEYLKNSYVLESRSLVQHNFSLPILGVVLMIIPLLLGAPHLPYYKSISPATNFQEVLGGYTGLIVVLAAILGIFRYSKDILIRFWTIVILVSLAMAYNIWPIKYINALPLMSTSANHRLIAFVNFGLLVIFCYILHRFLTEKRLARIGAMMADKVFLLLLLFVIAGTIVAAVFLPQYFPKYTDFIPFLLWHSLSILLSTIFFFWSLSWYVQKRMTNSTFLFVCFVLVSFQTIGFFWNYNPVVDKKYFYPTIQLIQILEKQPKGNIIEVGNPSLPPNVNMKYQIPHVVNNDAVEVLWYRHAFAKAFPKKNLWGNPENASIQQLQKLYVSYVLSDYDITFSRKKIQPDGSSILPPITKAAPYIITFKPEVDILSQLRVKTATFNRQNMCQLSFKLFQKSTHREVMRQQIPCADMRNNMFYTLSMPPISLEKNDEYQLEVRSNSENDTNAVAFFGIRNEPFLELLSQPKAKSNDFTLLGKTKSTYVWKVNGVKRIEGVKDYKILYENPQRLVLDVYSRKPTDIIIKKTYYPGWEASVNGKAADLQNTNPFMKLHVGAGKSYIEITYKPLSFFVGVVITLFSGTGIILYILRNEREKLWRMYKNLSIDKKIKERAFWQHVVVVGFSLALSSVLFAIFVLNFPVHLENPWTTAINWFTKHNYPRYQDYVYFSSGFMFVFVFILVFWLFWLWRKKR